jgi:cytochrome b561/DNA-binding MarR family transcriptional regulator
MALMVLAMMFIGVGMVSTAGPLYPMLLALHRPVGIAILVLVLIRLPLRLLTGAPPLPSDLPQVQQLVAKGSHVLLYASMLGMPLIGWAMLSAGAIRRRWAAGAASDLPHDLALYAFLRWAHTVVALLFFALILAHLGAALMHGLIRRDGVLRSMTTGHGATRRLPRDRTAGTSLRMTLEQLRIFVEVARREHVTRAAQALNVTQSAASGAIAALEARHDVKLFHRVGRGIELTDAGRMFLEEAQAVLARAASAEQALADYGGLKRGTLRLVASQTIAGYWLPERLAVFHRRYPGIELSVAIDNTEGAARAVLLGDAELGLIEGAIDDPALAQWPVAKDRMVMVGPKPVEAVTNDWLAGAPWIMREEGSGTRSTFEAAVRIADSIRRR